MVVAGAALITRLLSDVDPATVTGIGTGLLLLGYAVLALVRVRRAPVPKRKPATGLES